MFLSGTGAVQDGAYLYYDGASADGGRIRTNAAGWGTGSYGFAEAFPSNDPLEAGDLVAFDIANSTMIRKAARGDVSNFLLAGIVSTRPGYLAGMNDYGSYPLALAGRVPAKVTAENGPVAIGDPITVSSTPGYGMKALEPGYIVGIALQAFDGSASSAKIAVYVRPGWYNGSGVIENFGNSAGAANASSQLSNSVLTSNLDAAGYALVNVGAISGLDNLWSIDGNGNMIMQEVAAANVKAKEITVEQTDESQATGEGTILVGNSTVTIDNPMVKPNSRIFITFYGNVEGGWWISRRVDGAFDISLQNLAGTDIQFEYLIVNVIDYRTPAEPAAELPPGVEGPVLPPPPPAEDPPPSDPEPTLPLDDSSTVLTPDA
jgi:hypothetical protein